MRLLGQILAIGGVMVVAVAATSGLIVVGFGALVSIAILIRVRRDEALLAIIFVLVLAIVPAQLIVPALGSVGSPQVLISLLALAVWAVDFLKPGGECSGELRPIPLLIVAFVLANLASYGSAGLRAIDLVEVTAADRGMVTVVASAGITLLLAETVNHEDRLDAVLRALVVAGTIVAVVGIVQFASGLDLAASVQVPGLESNFGDRGFISSRSIFRRVAGTTLHAIEFSVVISMVMPIAIHYALFRSRRWFIPVVLLGMALPMSVSRTAVVGVALASLVLLAGWPKLWRRRFYVGVMLYLVAMRLLIPGLLGTIRALFVDASADPSIQTRTVDYTFVSQFVTERPLFGRGFTTFIPSRYDFLDNQYLLSLVETGVVGLFAYVALLLGSMATARLVRIRSDHEPTRDLAQSLVASLAVVVGSSAAFDFLSFPTARALMFVIIGCIGAMWRIQRRSATAAPIADETLPAAQPLTIPMTPEPAGI